jgi:predicted nucleic acid-binding protein
VIFLDTSFLFPLFAVHDPDHQRVRQVMEGYRGKRMAERVLTTNHVVAETITLVRYKGSRQSEAAHALATEVGSALYAGTLARIHWSTAEDERAAFEYFKRHTDQEYSMVDCLSFVVMEQHGIREALAVDSDFAHRFTALPGPAR